MTLGVRDALHSLQNRLKINAGRAFIHNSSYSCYIEGKNGYSSGMMFRYAFCLSSGLVLSGPAVAAMADVSCDDSARMAETLTTVLGAERQGMGLRDPETMLEVWVTRTNGSWMIVQNYANGTSCIVAMGDHWEGVVKEPA